MNEKTVLKILALIASAVPLYMGLSEFAASLSQGALGDGDAALKAFLQGASMLFLGLAFAAAFKKQTFKIHLKRPIRINWTIQWAGILLYESLMFYGINVFDVHRYVVWHHVFTIGAVAGMYMIGWNYFQKKWARYLAIFGLTGTTGYFVYTVFWDKEKIDWGEISIILVSIWIAWIMINEQVKKWKR